MGTVASQHNHNRKVIMRARRNHALQQELLSSTIGSKNHCNHSSNFSMSGQTHNISAKTRSANKQRSLSSSEMRIIKGFNERRRRTSSTKSSQSNDNYTVGTDLSSPMSNDSVFI